MHEEMEAEERCSLPQVFCEFHVVRGVPVVFGCVGRRVCGGQERLD